MNASSIPVYMILAYNRFYFVFGTNMRIAPINIMVHKIAVDCPFRIPKPCPSLYICKNIVIRIPLPAAKKADSVDVFFENSPKRSGAVSETDIKE